MLFVISLITAALFVLVFHKLLKKKPVIFYLAAILIVAFTVIIDGVNISSWFDNYICAMFSRGCFSTALWVIIMYTGALKNGSKLIKMLMPIRGELSIFAAIITLGHNIVYGKIYFVNLFTNIKRMPTTQILAAVLTLIMIAILIPLTVTSFKACRKKMNGKSWKKLQRFAYLFYGLLYVHIMLVTFPSALLGKHSSVISVIIYTAVFLFYLVWRVRKYCILKKKASRKATALISVLIWLAGMVLCVAIIFSSAATGENSLDAGDIVDVGGSETTATVKPSETEEIELTNAQIFEGSAYGYDGEIHIQIYVLDGKIVKITGYTEESDDYYYNRAAKIVIPAILSAQDYEVDAVSGATYSSDAIMESVRQAMKKAGLLS